MSQNVGSVVLDILLGKNEVDGALGKLGGVASGVGKAVGAGLAAASGAILAVGKQAVSSYGEYEQLVGGVETLFKESADAVIANADNAFKTAGMSANTYMQTVTSFSASLLQSLDGDTKKATEYADMAITDMADNANKMGTSMESIQNAYQGFAKQNYTMLDNLKLGYGGTKGEMERLLEDASAIAGIEFDISSYADVVEAIHIIQQNMGITGTTALEASQTIQGSISAMGASWQNLLTGLTDETANLDVLIDNFVDSVITAGENLLPRITRVLTGITKVITELAPVIIAEIPKLINEILPVLLQGATELVNAIVEILPNLVAQLIPPLLEAFLTIVNVLIGTLPSLMQMICEMLPTLIPLLINGLVNMIVMLCTNFATIIQPLLDNLPEIIMSIVNGLLNNLPQLIQGVIALVMGIVQAMPQIQMGLLECIPQIITSVVEALVTCLPLLLQGIATLVGGGADYVMSTMTNFIEGVKLMFGDMWSKIGATFVNGWGNIKNGAVNAWNGVKSTFSGLADFFGNIFSNAWAKVKAVFSTGGKIFDGIKDGIVTAFKNIVNGIIRGINKVVAVPFNAINSVLNRLRGINILGVSPFGWLGSISVPKIPELEQGGVLKKGQVGLLEGKGAEAVIPLERNTGWLNRIADILNQKIGLGSFATAIERAVSAPALHNVKAGTSFGEQDNSKLNRLIELFERFIAEDNGDMTVPIYIGNELIDEYIVNKNSRQKLRSGGHA